MSKLQLGSEIRASANGVKEMSSEQLHCAVCKYLTDVSFPCMLLQKLGSMLLCNVSVIELTVRDHVSENSNLQIT